VCPVVSVGCGGSPGVVSVGASVGGLSGMVIAPSCCLLPLGHRCAACTWSGVSVVWSLCRGRWLFASPVLIFCVSFLLGLLLALLG